MNSDHLEGARLLFKQQAKQIFMAGVKAANPYQAVQQSLRIDEGRLEIVTHRDGAEAEIRSEPWSKIHLIAFGKAACQMAEAAYEIIPSELLSGTGLVVTHTATPKPLEGFEVISAGHPLPNVAGLDAADKLIQRLEIAQLNELVLVLVSGGGSALLPCPSKPLTLADKIATTELLLACGADIKQINCVRKHLSRLKGGGLARLACPASVHTLILSDVIGDDLSTIASGPTHPDPTTFADAIEVLQSQLIWEQVPERVRKYLTRGIAGDRAETPKKHDPLFERVGHTLIGHNRISVHAMQKAADAEGYTPQIYSTTMCGEARDEAEKLVIYALEQIKSGSRPKAIIAGGETTVTLNGNGQGGRNQEFALAFALAAERHGLGSQWLLLSGATDGRDGPTDAAGGIVDALTLKYIAETGVEAQVFLDNNDSYLALKGAGDLLDIGVTGINVADLQVLLIQA